MKSKGSSEYEGFKRVLSGGLAPLPFFCFCFIKTAVLCLCCSVFSLLLGCFSNVWCTCLFLLTSFGAFCVHIAVIILCEGIFSKRKTV